MYLKFIWKNKELCKIKLILEKKKKRVDLF